MKTPVNLYDLAYMGVFLPAAAMVRYKMHRHGKYRESAPALLGGQLREDADNPLFAEGCVWIHAVSVGEVIAARAMLPLLKAHFSPLPLLMTTHTETGQATARNLPEGLVDAVRYLPLDFSWLMRRATATWKPKCFILMETELWPNMLEAVADSGAKIFTLNGKISERSFRSYSRFRPLVQRPLSRVTAFCAQTPADAERIASLTGRGDNVHVTGNCKFDVPPPVLSEQDKTALAQRLGLDWPAPILVAGSTHAGEEEIVLDAFDQIAPRFPDLQLALVPRHPERFAEVWTMLEKRGQAARRTSDGSRIGTEKPRIHLVDQMGVLTQLYALSAVAVVAGSFVPGIGGHNLLEPAAFGVPVVYGPYMKSQPDMVRILTEHKAGIQVDAADLGPRLAQLFAEPEQANDNGRRAKAAFESSQGSAARNMEVLRRYL